MCNHQCVTIRHQTLKISFIILHSDFPFMYALTEAILKRIGSEQAQIGRPSTATHCSTLSWAVIPLNNKTDAIRNGIHDNTLQISNNINLSQPGQASYLVISHVGRSLSLQSWPDHNMEKMRLKRNLHETVCRQMQTN